LKLGVPSEAGATHALSGDPSAKREQISPFWVLHPVSEEHRVRQPSTVAQNAGIVGPPPSQQISCLKTSQSTSREQGIGHESLQNPGAEAAAPAPIDREPPTLAPCPEQAKTRRAVNATAEARLRAARIRRVSQGFMTRVS
jgi:hypothetical protein